MDHVKYRTNKTIFELNQLDWQNGKRFLTLYIRGLVLCYCSVIVSASSIMPMPWIHVILCLHTKRYYKNRNIDFSIYCKLLHFLTSRLKIEVTNLLLMYYILAFAMVYPLHTRTVQSFTIFKSLLKIHLFALAFNMKNSGGYFKTLGNLCDSNLYCAFLFICKYTWSWPWPWTQ